MSRFELYGDVSCRGCKYFGHSSLAKWRERCRHPNNFREDRLGLVYMKQPAELNWNSKCENYISSPKEEIEDVQDKDTNKNEC